jgi:SAM-dependent methyltransferase
MPTSLLKLREPKSYTTVDHSHLICCPFCKADLKKTGKDYTCNVHGLFKVDESNRPLLVNAGILAKNMAQHEAGVNWLKSFLKQFPTLYYSIWHIFCPVMMLVNGPRMILNYVKKGDTIIDLGSGPERLGAEFTNVDIFPFPQVDIVATATELPFRDNSIEALVSESLLEHVADAGEVAREITRVIKPGGYIYISAPFIHPYHASPDDFNRWTISGLKHLFPDITIVKSGVRSGPWSAFLMFLAYWLGVIFSFGSRKTAPFLAHIFMLILGPLKYPDYLFMKMPGAEAVAAHLYIVGIKKVQ